jgi:hypothetical protein
VVSIRPATKSEAAAGNETSAHFLEMMPHAISSLDKQEGVKKEDSKKGGKR